MRSEANFRLSECQPRPRLDSSPASATAFSHQRCVHEQLTHLERSQGEGSTGRVPDTGIPLSRLLQGGERLGGHRRPVLVARLVVLCAPPHHSAFKVDVRASKLTDGADAVSCLVCEDQSNVKAPVHIQRHVEQDPVILPR